MLNQEANNVHMNEEAAQQNVNDLAAEDSDYFSESERDSPVNDNNGVERNRSSNQPPCSVSEDWIELDLCMNSPILWDSLVVIRFLHKIYF